MKKSICLILSVVLCFAFSKNYAQNPTQLYRWPISPVQVEMQTSPQVTNIIEFPSVGSKAPVNSATFPAYTAHVANGMYDANNNLLFYVSNDGVYDKYSSLIERITPTPTNAEVVIVPFGNNGILNGKCQNKFNIFTMSEVSNQLSVIQSILDMDTYTLNAGNVVDQFQFQIEYGALAVSQAVNGLNGTDRYLYSIAASGTSSMAGEVRRLTIDINGNISNAAFFFQPNYYAAINCFTLELDLSPDGQYLLWASWLHDVTTANRERYHLLPVNNFAGYDQFEISNTSNNTDGYRGVEFDASSTKLYLGAGSHGIYETDLTHSYFLNVLNSGSDYGCSQIELSFNGKMYVAKNDNSGLINSFDPSISTPAMLGGTDAFTLFKGSAIECPKVGQGSAAFYTLPDQIDGEDYSVNLSPAPTQGGSMSTYDFDQGSATWQYGTSTSDNPWASTTPIQVIHELRISDKSHLTIKGMKFQFSPDAKVVIEPGSSLILDYGAILSSDYAIDPCLIDATWIGVEVWGDKTLSQNRTANQSKLTLLNGSTIEHAKSNVVYLNSDDQALR